MVVTDAVVPADKFLSTSVLPPQDRLGNRYLINFVDHKSNYCRIFLARTKDKAAKLEAFLYFLKRFGCRIYVLRTDGGGEYGNVDLFCKKTGVSRQVSEARDQVSNGKAERMHRTVLNLARSMMFASALPLHFRGDAVQYAAHILPNLREIVGFGSLCSVYRDPRKNSLKHRAQASTIIGISEETKGFRVYLRKENKLIITKHVTNIDILSYKQNEQLCQSPFRSEHITPPILSIGELVPLSCCA